MAQIAKTIYALSTPLAKSAIAIIRVSGRNTKKSLFLLTGLKDIKPFKFHLVTLKNLNNEVIDKPLVVFFPKNNSYTGEDLVEYHIHGSIAIIKELLHILSTINDHRLAYRGEFTKRALENNKMNLIEVEGLLDLLDSETSYQKQQALQAYNGVIGNKYKYWLNEVKENLSLIEASIDFSEEELPDDLLNNIDEKIHNLIKIIKNELSNYKGAIKLKNGINITIIGVPNVGKSTLINYLSNDDIAITSNIPGTTRDAISTALDFQGFPIIITDTAGIRNTKDPLEQIGINKSLLKAKESDLNLIVLSAIDLVNSISKIKDFFTTNYILIVNKIDLITEQEKIEILKTIKDYDVKAILISLKNFEGIENLKKELINKFENISKTNEHPLIINERHKIVIEELLKNLICFTQEKDIVFKSYYLRNAMNSLGSILGLNNIEDILDKIFSKFCIGK